MTKSNLIKTFFTFIFYCIVLKAAQSKQIYYADYIYEPDIQTVQFFKSGSLYSYPILELGNPNESLLLSFDDLSGNRKDFQYSIIHCDANWNPSDLFTNQYIDGSPYESVINYESSFNTYQKYTHYWLYLPGNYMKPKINGNYILKVYYADNEDSLVITRRFYVYQNKIVISAIVKRPTYAKYRNTGQEIDFEVSYYSGLNLMNPMNDIRVVIRQNQRWDNPIVGLRPKFISDNTMIFDYEEENLFEGVNEFRNIDLRSYRNAGYGVKKIYLDSLYNFILYPDEDLSYNSYSNWSDINGERVISGENASIPINEVDYVMAHFKLLTPYPKDEGDVYLFGALTDWRLQDQFKLNYNDTLRLYETNVKLKQGYYNYHYVEVNKENGYIDATRFQGCHYEAENDYAILIYFKTPELNVDELLGVSFINSVKNR
jgi:hypothetical protein